MIAETDYRASSNEQMLSIWFHNVSHKPLLL